MRILYRGLRKKRSKNVYHEIVKEVNRTLDKVVKPELLAYFVKITANWKNKPKWKARRRVKGQDIIVYVWPEKNDEAKIWEYVSGGTKPHKIRAKKKGGTLAFMWGGKGSYKPKTTTSGGYKGPGTIVNPVLHQYASVNHPGNKPRNFEKHIARWYGPKFKKHMKNAIARATRRAAA